MTDNDRNTRTLLVSFVIAIMVLIPLRFIEVGQNSAVVGETQVLGEQVEIEEKALEAPYDEIESEGCWTREMADEEISEMTEGLDAAVMTREELDGLSFEVAKLEAKVCE